MSAGEIAQLAARHCPTCGPQPSAPFVGSKPPGEEQAFAVLAESWFGFFKKKVFFTYHRCWRCGLLFCPRYFTDEQLAQLYRDMPDNTAGASGTNLERTQHGYLEALGPGFMVEGDYLELGPDIGLFTRDAARRLRGGKLWLFEPNASVHGALANSLGGASFEISREMRDFGAVPDATVGLCVMIHVLDHLPDPGGVVRQLARKLRPGGRLLIVTHDERSLLARILGRRWPAFCLQHPQLFNRRSIEAFLHGSGLRTIHSRRSVNYFALGYLVKHLLYALGVTSAGAWPIWGPTLPLRLGNRITIAQPSD